MFKAYTLFIRMFFCVVFSCCFISCNFLSKESRTQEIENKEKPLKQETINNYGDNYTVIPNLDHPKFKELSEAFDKEEHRFEIDACEFKYNGQSFFIGDPMEKMIAIFGEPDGDIIESINGESITHNYKFLNIKLRYFIKNKKLKFFSLAISDHLDGHINTPYNFLLFRKVPYQLDMTLNEFMELSDMDHEKIGHNLAAFYIKNESKCKSYEKFLIGTEIGSRPAYDNIGGGHLTIRGDFDPNVTGPIRSISIYIKD